MRNIEIKARIDDPAVKISRVKQLTTDEGKIIKQHDTFFKIPNVTQYENTKLKLRRFEDDSGELIYYHRANTLDPKLSTYEKTSLDLNACAGIERILSASNGCLGIVKKTRILYMVGQTRVHIDEVEGLGNFLELEVVLTDEQDTNDGQKIAEDLMTKLDIKSEDLIANAYIDLLTDK
ncbi:uncharacterized protein LOC108632527 [Ceratina calcarata]|uniref:Uncharacterized protein LOC108632527 n=1 Tax=Ceratina calcarata TaxID=156304 RepID=A0AAJ7JH32_9HYME|nr:uncharacterized protein LOC108632527 [Ceratina calcarata]